MQFDALYWNKVSWDNLEWNSLSWDDSIPEWNPPTVLTERVLFQEFNPIIGTDLDNTTTWNEMWFSPVFKGSDIIGKYFTISHLFGSLPYDSTETSDKLIRFTLLNQAGDSITLVVHSLNAGSQGGQFIQNFYLTPDKILHRATNGQWIAQPYTQMYLGSGNIEPVNISAWIYTDSNMQIRLDMRDDRPTTDRSLTVNAIQMVVYDGT